MADYEVVDVPSFFALTKLATCSHAELGPTMGRLYGEIGAAHPEAELAAPPVCFYLSWREADCDIECGLPVEAGTPEAKHFPACRAVRAVHQGPYANLHEAWIRLWGNLGASGLAPEGSPWDSYVTDPEQESDASQWITEIFIPIRS